MVSGHYHSANATHRVPRYLAYLFAFYLAFASPATYAIGAAAETAATSAARAAAVALGAGEGLGVAALGLGAAAAAVGAFALTFCATSYVMGTGLCSPDDPATGGGIGAAIQNPASSQQYVWVAYTSDGKNYFCSSSSECQSMINAYYATNPSQYSGYAVSCSGPVNLRIQCERYINNSKDFTFELSPVNNPSYNPSGSSTNSPDVAGDNIAKNPRATSAVAAAAAAKARGATDQTAVTAARAASTATGTGNPARDRAAGNTAAAAAAAAAAAEAAGASPAEVEKAAKDAANTAAAAADKSQPQDKTCQSNGASIDGRYCTDTAVNPDAGALPVFCQWAVSVCGFFDWVKEEPVVATAEATNVTPEKDTYDTYNLPTNPQKSVTVNFGGQCPSDVTIPVFMGIEWKFSYQAACTIAGYAKYAFIGVASITAIFIVTGNREPD